MALCVYTVLYGVTQWLQAGRGLSSQQAGLILLPMSAVSGIIARPVSQRNLLRVPLIVAAVSCLAGSAGVLLLTRGTPIAWIVIVTLVFGITLGTGVSANQTALYTQVPAAQIGTASGLFRTSARSTEPRPCWAKAQGGYCRGRAGPAGTPRPRRGGPPSGAGPGQPKPSAANSRPRRSERS